MQTLAYGIVVVMVALSGCSKSGGGSPTESDSRTARPPQSGPLSSISARASATPTSVGGLATPVTAHDDATSPRGHDLRSFSQAGMNDAAAFEAKQAEKEMEATLQLVEQRRASEVALVKAIERAQAEWLKFRTAELEALFPEENKQTAYGSMYNMCHAQQRKRLTQLRTAELRFWIDGDPEARGCSGAVSSPEPPMPHN